MSTESKSTFFRQSGWLVIANTLAGMFMVGVHPFASRMPEAEYGLFTALLRLFMVLSIPAAGLQIVLAQKTAAAIQPEQRAEVAAASRGILKALILLWLVVGFVLGMFQNQMIASFKIVKPAALWVTWLVVLPALGLPLFQGMLQGVQNFSWLGLSMILNGVGRCGFIAIIVLFLHGEAAGAMTGTFCGVLAGMFLAFWPMRQTLRLRGTFHASIWLKRLLPLTLGAGSVLFLINVDIIAVQSHFPKNLTPFYAAGGMVGVGLVTFTTPMASVMFPKLVRSFAQSETSNALWLAIGGTAVLGIVGALLCTIFPELPLRIMYFRNPDYLKAAVLVPWFMWCLLPVTVANVLVSNLLARERFAVVPWLVFVAAGYGFALFKYAAAAGLSGDAFAAFRHIIQILGIFSTLLLIIATIFNWRELRGRGADA